MSRAALCWADKIEVTKVHWFRDVAWNDVVGAAVSCVTVTGVWWTFWPSHRERLRKLRQGRLEHLRRVTQQVDRIGDWASTVYTDANHDPQWYNASWGVRGFDWSLISDFNQAVIEGDFSPKLTKALLGLEESAKTFHRRLADQIGYLSHAPQDIGLKWPRVVEASATKRRALSTEELGAIDGLTELDRQWLADLYRRNKATHVEGIGGPGNAGLHAAWSAATSALAEVRAGLQTGRDTRWKWAGHIAAFVFAVVGLLFLIDFVWSFGEARLPPKKSASAHSTSTSPDPAGATLARPDTMHSCCRDSTNAGTKAR